MIVTVKSAQIIFVKEVNIWKVVSVTKIAMQVCIVQINICVNFKNNLIKNAPMILSAKIIPVVITVFVAFIFQSKMAQMQTILLYVKVVIQKMENAQKLLNLISEDSLVQMIKIVFIKIQTALSTKTVSVSVDLTVVLFLIVNLQKETLNLFPLKDLCCICY